jgi:hypothetical protein
MQRRWLLLRVCHGMKTAAIAIATGSNKPDADDVHGIGLLTFEQLP